VQRVNSELGVFQAEAGRELQRFNGQIAKYNASLGKAVQVMGKDVAQFTNDMSKYAGVIQAKATVINNEFGKAKSYLDEASLRLQTGATYMNKSQAIFGSSRDYYQRAIQELSAISGAVTAPPQQQQTQRQEQGATS